MLIARYIAFFGALLIPVLTSAGENKSLNFHQVIARYKALDSLYEEARVMGFGKTDDGHTLNLFIISKEKNFDPYLLKKQNFCVLFINNGIHPGEPDGIDASVLVAEKLLAGGRESLPDSVAICILPVFNIEGALNRGCCSRANQNGPEEYGFRGSGQNLDLNRDFIKVDSRNTHSLIRILRLWDPDVILDTHVSDGADYAYTMTLIASQHNKMNATMGKYMKSEFTPEIFHRMAEKRDTISYHVNCEDPKTPDEGFAAYLETPRYLSGYGSLFNAYCFISESHMLKPFEERRSSTMRLIESLIDICADNRLDIRQTRALAYREEQKLKTYSYNYECDSSKSENIEFAGYEAAYKPSRITGMQRLYYDRTRPYVKKIPFYNTYRPTKTTKVPRYFLIPSSYNFIAGMLELNNVEIIRVSDDSSTNATVQYIEDFETTNSPYEGHYLHYNVRTRNEVQKVRVRNGDYLIPLDQQNKRFILETLLPDAVDSYFCWGFFDSWLQQKEWFSPYVFEDTGAELLETDPAIRKQFEEWKGKHPDASSIDQLYYLYRLSPYFEKETFRRYPIYTLY